MSELWTTRYDPPRLGNSPISCAVCGCRLMAAGEGSEGGWRHLPSLEPGRDARGCSPRCVNDLHDGVGYALAEAVA